MKRRIVAVALSLCMALTLLPPLALAEEIAPDPVDSAALQDGSAVSGEKEEPAAEEAAEPAEEPAAEEAAELAEEAAELAEEPAAEEAAEPAAEEAAELAAEEEEVSAWTVEEVFEEETDASEEENTWVAEEIPEEEEEILLPDAPSDEGSETRESALEAPGPADGEALLASGDIQTANGTIRWKLDLSYRLTLDVPGSGSEAMPMPDYSNAGRDVPWYDYREDIKTVSVGERILSIGAYAFYGCESLTDVSLSTSVSGIGAYAFANCASLPTLEIPQNVTIIGEGAFSYCTGMSGIVLPNNVMTAGPSAFAYCSHLSSVTLSDSLDSISNSMFRSCTALVSIVIPDSVSSIGEYAFSNCDNLLGIAIPGSVTSMGNYAFNSCKKLSNVTIASGLASIPNYAFYNCTALAKLALPGSVSSLGYEAFYHCDSLTSIALPDSIATMGDEVFAYCGKLTSVTIPAQASTIPYRAFYSCTSLASVTMSGCVTSIGTSAFYSCSKLMSITIPDSVTSIGNYAFSNCSSLSSFEIPANVATIGTDAFYPCASMTGFTVAKENEQFSAASGVLFNRDQTTLISYPAARADTSYTIPNSVTSIYANAFRGGGSLMNITIPGSVQQIKDSSFYQCSSLTNVTILNGVNSIGSSAFRNCGKLAKVSIPASVTRIGSYAFAYCSALKTVMTAEGLEEIGSDAFDSCYKLEKFSIPASVTSIGSYAFAYCYALQGVSIANSGTCLIIPKGITSLPYDAFYYCYALKAVAIPKSLTSIGSSAFYGCSGLNTVYYEGNSSEWSRITINSSNAYLTNATRCYETWPVATYKVIFHPAGGTVATTSQNVTNGDVYGELPVPTWEEGDGFLGWFTEEWGGDQITADSVVNLSENQILYAHWDIDVLVMFSANGGRIKTKSFPYKIVKYGKPYGELAKVTDPPKKELDGWYTAAQGGEFVEEDTLCKTRLDHTLYAHYFDVPDVVPPTVTTINVADISSTSATFSGRLENDGDYRDDTTTPLTITVGFVYWDFYDASSRYTVTAAKPDANGLFKVTVNNLSPSSTYVFYAFAENSAGEGRGNNQSFETLYTDEVTSVSLRPTLLTLNEGASSQLMATVLPVNAKDRSLTWTTSDSNVAAVDDNGKVRAIFKGKAVITATSVNDISAKCTVEVIDEQPAPGEYDLSELNMATNSASYALDGNGYDVYEGGNRTMASSYLARQDGPVLEKNDPYPSSYISDYASLYKEEDADYHVQEIIWLPARSYSGDNNELKAALMKYGAAYVSFTVNWNYFDSARKNYYYPESGSGSSGGHAVACVGWDDNYDASNFVDTPPGNGAFICKNSWGTSSGEKGYFYISYYDKYFAGNNGGTGGMVVPTVESKTNYNKVYQYDPLGPISDLSINKTAIYVANVFPEKGKSLDNDETLKAVSFYTYSKNTSYEIYVVQNYQSIQSLKNLGTAVAVGGIQEMGYHTIQLGGNIILNAGSRFAIVVKLSASSGYAHAYYEYPKYGYSSKAKANADESYYSADASVWTDLTQRVENANFCLKAFTNDANSGSAALMEAVDNDNRAYESEKVYTLDEVLENGIPINQNYVAWERQGGEASLQDTAEGTPLSVVPDIINVGENDVSFVRGAVLPSKYDLRTEGCVTDVRNQGGYGHCWTFATYASLESCLLKKAKTLSSDTLSQVTDVGEYIAQISQFGIPVTKVTLSDSSVTITGKNQTYRLIATLAPENATDTSVTWSSSKESVATVDTNGVVTTKGFGVATIKATSKATNTDSALVASCKVYVYTTAPVLSSATASFGSITVKWKAVSGASKYEVLRKVGTGSWKSVGTVTGTSYVDENVTAGKKYTYSVRCLTSGGTTISTYDTTGKSATAYYATPTLSSATASFGSITVKWKAVSGISCYRLLRKVGTGSWKTVGVVTGTSYVDENVTAGTKYTYSLRCLGEDQTTVLSEYDTSGKSAIAYYATPTLSSATASTGKITVTWKAVDGVDCYRLLRKVGTGSWSTVGVFTGTSYVDENVTAGKQYTYSLRCLTSDGKTVISGYDTTGKSAIAYYATPTLSSATASFGKITVKWKAVDGVNCYRLLRKIDDGSWKTLCVVSKLGTSYADGTFTYADENVQSGKKYTYSLRCLADDETTILSSYDTTGKSAVAYYATPTLSSATAYTGKITFKWQAVDGVTYYRLLRKEGSGSWKTVGVVTGTSYTDKNVTAGTKYTYSLRCLGNDKTTLLSNYNTTGKSATAK